MSPYTIAEKQHAALYDVRFSILVVEEGGKRFGRLRAAGRLDDVRSVGGQLVGARHQRASCAKKRLEALKDDLKRSSRLRTQSIAHLRGLIVPLRALEKP